MTAKLSCFAAGLFLLGFTYPNPENLILFLGSAGLGAGTGIGLGYAAYVSRASAAKIEALRKWDEAYRQSNQAKLDTAVRQHEEAMAQIQDNVRNLQVLRDELDEERARNEKLAQDLVDFAKRVLVDKGYLKADPPDVS
jgi:hypothetical protein